MTPDHPAPDPSAAGPQGPVPGGAREGFGPDPIFEGADRGERVAPRKALLFQFFLFPLLVVVASVAGLGGVPLAAPYAASKHGAVGLVRSLALEFAKTNLTVNAVCPAFVDTPMTDASADRIVARTGRSEAEARDALASLNPNGRLVTPEEVAASILHLCHPSSRSITGSCLTVDGGATA